jgi:translation elongation factor EF-1beta
VIFCNSAQNYVLKIFIEFHVSQAVSELFNLVDVRPTINVFDNEGGKIMIEDIISHVDGVQKLEIVVNM